MMNLGDVPAGSILYVPFATYNAAGASVTITGLAVTDIEIFKDGSVTQRASDAGYVLLDTDGIDFDGITGIHGFSVDLGDNTTAGFYVAGSTYWLVVSAITVDSQTVNFVYYFTIDKRNVLRPTVAGRTLDVSAGGEAGLDWANIGSPTTAQNLSATNIDVDQVVASVSGAVATVTALAANSVNASALAADAAAEIADAVWDEDATGHQTTGTFGQAIGDPVADTNTIYKAVVTDATGATVGVDVVAVKAQTAAIEVDTAEIGTAGAGLTNINLPNQTMDIVGSITGSLSGSVGSVGSGGISEASFATTAGSFAPLGVIDQGTAQSATGTTLVLRSAAAFADDEIIGATIVIVSATAGAGQSRTITDYVSSTDTATVATWTTTPTGTIVYKIHGTSAQTAGSAPTAAEVADAVWDEAQSGHVAGGSFGETATEIAAILVDTGTTLDARIPAALVSGRIDASVGAMAANVMTAAAAAADLTTELQSGLATAAALTTVDDFLDTEIAAIVTATGAAAIRTAVGLASANLDTQLADKTGYRLSATGVDDVLDEVVEGAVTLRQAARLWNSAMGAKASGLATTTAIYRDLGDTKDRITGTVDSSGNRSVVTLDLT